jgi:phosphoribosylformylglycinamidine synthase
MMCDTTGRHLVMMPHIERSTFPMELGYPDRDQKRRSFSWLEAFVNART